MAGGSQDWKLEVQRYLTICYGEKKKDKKAKEKRLCTQLQLFFKLTLVCKQ